MLIKRIKLQNFKKFQNKEFEFKEENKIYGKNGEGKSTIADAIFFCFYGRTSEGSLAESTKYIKDGEAKCLVEVEFEKDGQDFTVRRERTESQTRITFIDGSQSEEDSVITQRELESMVPDYELMQSVFNVGYFMSLTDKEKREFLLRLTPEIDKEKLYTKLGGTEELSKKYPLNFFDIEATHKMLLKRNRENNEELVRIKAVIDESSEIEVPEITLKDRSEELALEKDKYKKFLEVEQLWRDYSSKVLQYNADKTTNEAIEKQIAEIKIEEVVEPSQLNLNNLKLKRNELRPTIHITEEKCPTCLQDITDEHKNKVLAVNHTRLENIAKIEDAIEKETANYNQKLAKYQEYIQGKSKKQSLKNSLREIVLPEEPTEQRFEFDTAEERETEALQREYESESIKIELLQSHELERQGKISQLRERVVLLVTEINEVNKLLPIFSVSGIPQLEMEMKITPIIEEIKKLLPTAEIKLLELLKNKLAYKEVFSLSVEGIEYAKLSHGQKMSVDITLSQVIDDLSDKKVGCYFIDNAESISSEINVGSQSFIAVVNNNELNLCTQEKK
jgi:exonuclease SbcC